MVLFSLEDPQDIALCGGGERARDWTCPGEQLQSVGQGEIAGQDGGFVRPRCHQSPC